MIPTMKITRSTRVALATVLCLAGATAFYGARDAIAQGSAQPAPTMIAIVNIEKVANEVAEARDLLAALKTRAESRQKTLDELADRMKALDAELKLLPENDRARKDKLAQLFELRATYEARAQALQRLVDLEQGSTMREIAEKVIKTAGAVGKRNGYAIVLSDDRDLYSFPEEATPAQIRPLVRSRSILWADDRLDITAQVIAQMNNDYAAAIKK